MIYDLHLDARGLADDSCAKRGRGSVGRQTSRALVARISR